MELGKGEDHHSQLGVYSLPDSHTSYVNIVWAAGAATGAPLGGLLVDSKFGWRGSFSVQVPLCVAAVLANAFLLKLPSHEETDWKEKLRRIDFLGAAVLTVAVSNLLIALDRGSNVAWKDLATVTTLGVSLLFGTLFFLVEAKGAKEPIAPSHVVFQRSMTSAYGCYFFSLAGWTSAMFYLPLFYQAVTKATPETAGLLMLPNILASVSGSVAAGYIMKKTGKYYWLTLSAYVGVSVGMVIILLFSGIMMTSLVGIVIGATICGFGNGVGITSSLITLSKCFVTACACRLTGQSLTNLQKSQFQTRLGKIKPLPPPAPTSSDH